MIDLFLPFIVGMVIGIEPDSTQDSAPEPRISISVPYIDTGSGDYLTTRQEPEPQVLTGKYTTAIEARPIFETSKNRWVSVVEYQGADRVYFAYLLGFRCGLWDIRIGINGEPAERGLGMEPCHGDSFSPNAMHDTVNFPPFVTYPAGVVDSVHIEIVFDDGTTDFAEFNRNEILIQLGR